jgi:hypothetical protein
MVTRSEATSGANIGVINTVLPASAVRVFDQSDIDSFILLLLLLLLLLLPPPPPKLLMLDFSVSGGRTRSPSSF